MSENIEILRELNQDYIAEIKDLKEKNRKLKKKNAKLSQEVESLNEDVNHLVSKPYTHPSSKPTPYPSGPSRGPISTIPELNPLSVANDTYPQLENILVTPTEKLSIAKTYDYKMREHNLQMAFTNADNVVRYSNHTIDQYAFKQGFPEDLMRAMFRQMTGHLEEQFVRAVMDSGNNRPHF